jgi:SAM-dependent methyltransferase
MRDNPGMFVCPATGGPLEELYSERADVLYPSIQGVPVLVPSPHQFLARHGPWDPTLGVAGQQQRILGVSAPDAVTPFLAPAELGASGRFGDFLLDLGRDTPEDWIVDKALPHAPQGVCVDLGAGLGQMAARMAAAQREVVILDRSAEAVLLCRGLLHGQVREALVPSHRRGCMLRAVPRPPGGQLHFAIADACAPPLAPESVAWIHLGRLLDVLEPEQLVQALVQSVQRLQPAGVLSLTTGYDAPSAVMVPDEAPPEAEMREVLDELGLDLIEERDQVPSITRLYDRRFEVRLVHCMVLRRR